MNSNKAKNTKNIIHLLNDRTNTSKSIRPNEFDAPIELLEADGVIHTVMDLISKGTPKAQHRLMEFISPRVRNSVLDFFHRNKLQQKLQKKKYYIEHITDPPHIVRIGHEEIHIRHVTLVTLGNVYKINIGKSTSTSGSGYLIQQIHQGRFAYDTRFPWYTIQRQLPYMRQIDILLLFMKFSRNSNSNSNSSLIANFFYNKQLPNNSQSVFRELRSHEWWPATVNEGSESVLLKSNTSPDLLKMTWIYEPMSDTMKIRNIQLQKTRTKRKRTTRT